MKSTRKYSLITIMALLGGVLAVGSCQKENNTDGIPEGAVLLTAEGFGGMEGDKTSVSAESVVWENGDRVSLNGAEYTVTVSGNKAYVTDFNNPRDPFRGIYPAGLVTGTETVNISLQYFSQRLNQIFTLSDNINLNSDESTGIDEDYIPPFTLGSAKYPIVKTVGVESQLTKAGVPYSDGNIIGAFVGEECRGLAKLSATGNTPLVIYGRSAGEWVTLKYYDAAKGILYTIPDAVRI